MDHLHGHELHAAIAIALAVLLLTLLAFPELRGGKSSASRPRSVAAPAAARPGSVLGANQAWRDEATLPVFSAAEVRKHATREDAWVIIDGKVYDVTAFVEDHPGGDAILNNAGGDATKGFHGPQHPDHVQGALASGWRVSRVGNGGV